MEDEISHSERSSFILFAKQQHLGMSVSRRDVGEYSRCLLAG